LQIKTKIVSCHTADSKPVKQEVNGRVILPPLVFPGYALGMLLFCIHFGSAHGAFLFSLAIDTTFSAAWAGSMGQRLAYLS
jgi:hypothetical protein